MKTLAFLPVFFCCLLVSDAQQSSVGTTLRGHLEGDSYRNDYFGFTYKLPAGFENAPDQLQRGFIQGLQNSNKGSQLLLMIVRPESAAIPDIIVVTTIPQRPSSRDGLNQALDYFRTKRLENPQKEGLRAAHPINLGGFQFAREDLKDSGLGQSSAEIASVLKEQLLNFAIYTASQQRMEQVATELIQSVTFDSSAPSKKGHPSK